MEEHILEVRDNYAPRLAYTAAKIGPLLKSAAAWAKKNPGEFRGLKSIEMTHGTVGYRTGQPKLKLLKGWTWEKVLATLKPLYVRTKREPDKEALLAARRDIGAEGFASVGLLVDQDETFFVEPKREPVQAVEVKEQREAS